MHRRTLLKASAGLLPVVAGCIVSPPPASDDRRLALYTEVTETESEWTLDIRVRNVGNRSGDSVFHDVTVLVYSAESALICQKHVGTVAFSEEITIVCKERPYLLTTDAEESPCDENIKLEVLRYRDTTETSDRKWDVSFRECGEGLPPKPPE